MSTPTGEDRAKARGIAGPCAHFKPLTSPDCISWDRRDDRSCDPCLLTRRITLALAAERERVLAACAAVADNRADTMNRLGKAEQDRGDLGGALRCSLMAGALTELADAIRALGATPQPETPV